MLKLYKFKMEFRSCDGDVSGLFIADDSEINSSIGKPVYFGEINGKSTWSLLEENNFEIISSDQNYIERTLEIFREEGVLSGLNPLNYIENY